jgi:glycosyltransferase involved in cell wall biosynthesis
MKVACLIWQGTRWRGGWNYYLNMARVLREHCPEVNICVYAPADTDATARAEAKEATGFDIGVLPPSSRMGDIGRLFAGHHRDLARRLASAGVDVVIEQASFLGRNFPIPVVAWIADLQHRTYPQYFSFRGRVTRDVGYWAQTAFRRHVYVSSASARRDLTAFIAHPKASIEVVPFAIHPNVTITQEGVSAVRSRYDLPERYALLPNQLWQHKNHALAIRATGLLSRRGLDVRIVLSGARADRGDNSHFDNLAALSETVGARDHLSWLGDVPYADLLHLMAGAQVLINPSQFEGWSTTVEEAKALGVPMILSDIDVHVEQARCEATFFPPDDPEALADLIEAAWCRPLRDMAATWKAAAERNKGAQIAYALRLKALFVAAATGPGE